ncbi:MAG: response regulator, partial [Sporichthyaceae bacterium]|nr:response regulator [Sporichthyaceae bacterium]
RVHAEVLLREARDAAERTARARSAFLANMSHEIRTPMNGILGMTEVVLGTELAPDQRRSLLMVQHSAEALLTIINDILDFSKIEADRLDLEEIPFDLPALVESVTRLLSVRASEGEIELICDVDVAVPRRVRGDPGRLRQVLTNLVGNAIKFTHEGDVVVKVAVVGEIEGSPRVQFTVRDSGIGITPEHLPRLFEEFSQADASTTRRYGGTGLGLVISRRLVRLMGGDIVVSSQPGRGSEFSFDIQMPAEPAADDGPELHDVGVLRAVRGLVVDDNPTNRRVIRELLAPVGCHLDEATGTADALERLRLAAASGRPYQLALIDACMPDQDGFQLAEAVRADQGLPGLRLIMLTSAGRRGDAQRCRTLGIDGYLVKPVGRADLLEATTSVLAEGVASANRGLVTRHSIEETRRKLRVLVAEDNPVNQEVAAAVLRRRGHDVTVVENGRLAVTAVAANRFDVVLMDMQMPELDGLAATREIRATDRGRNLPIIALTAHALASERDRCLA